MRRLMRMRPLLLMCGVLTAAASAGLVLPAGPADAKTHSAELAAVSCVGSTQCMAVGSYINGAGKTAALAEVLDGRTWRLVSPARLLGRLTGVSCSSASFCVAVGAAGKSGTTSVAVSWNGIRWRVMATPDPANGPLYDVSCVSRSFCMATGGQAGAELWRGRRWRLSGVPLPPGSTSGLAAHISCDYSGFCLAVGYYTTDPQAHMPQALGETWSGHVWSATGNVAFPPDGKLTSTACTRHFGCMAVGNFNANVTARWFLGWHLFPAPGPTALTAVSCVNAASNCMAVGHYTQAGTEFDLADVWNGKTWHTTTSPNPAADLTAVSCPQARHCVAVGSAANQPTAEIWNGKTWRHLKTRNP